MATVQLPNGVKARTQTKRRFVAFNERGKPVKRSDNPDTILKFAATEWTKFRVKVFIFDQRGGRFV